MQRDVVKRKNRVIKHIKLVRGMDPNQRSHEHMCACYIFTFGALEFMLETLIRSWIQSRIQKHKLPYRGKSSVDSVIKALEQLAETNLKANHGISYGNTCELVGKLAGDHKKQDIKAAIDSLPGGASALTAAISRIETMRHNIAHGAFWPDETAPNLDELETDFLFIYDGLIKTLNSALPRY